MNMAVSVNRDSSRRPDTTYNKLWSVYEEMSDKSLPKSAHRDDIATDEVYGIRVGRKELHELEAPILIYISDKPLRNFRNLRILGVTHFLNTNLETDRDIESATSIYKSELKFLMAREMGAKKKSVMRRFFASNNFIEDAFCSGGIVFIEDNHSSGDVMTTIAYLMMKRGLTAEKAIRLTGGSRHLNLSGEHVKEIADLENTIWSKNFRPTPPIARTRNKGYLELLSEGCINVKELKKIYLETCEKFKSLTNDDRNRYYSDRICDKVYKRIFLGDPITMEDDKTLLDELGITHIVYTIPESISESQFGTKISDLKKHFRVLTFEDMDKEEGPILDRFLESNNFIYKAIEIESENVYITGFDVSSRDIMIVVAYLMMKEDFTPTQAIRRIGGICEFNLSENQIEDIAELNKKLHKKKKKNSKTKKSKGYGRL